MRDYSHEQLRSLQSAAMRSDGSPIRVLIVDDDHALAELVSMAVRHKGWDADIVCDGTTAIRRAQSREPDLVILEVALPDMSGLDVVRRLRALFPQLPVVLLSTQGSLQDRIAGWATGGDDYVTKPFSLEELVLRLGALLRRSTMTADDSLIVVGDLVLDQETYEVTRDGQLLHLTPTEFELLRFMMLNSRRVVSREQILDRVWNCDYRGSPSVVQLYVSYLRKKIDAGRQPMIHTLRGTGYILKPPR